MTGTIVFANFGGKWVSPPLFDCVLCVDDPLSSSEGPGNTNIKFVLEFIILKNFYLSNAILDSIGFEV